MMTPEQYEESLRKLNLVVYMFGKRVQNLVKGRADIPTEHRMRILRLIENLTLGTAATNYRTESMHGAGSPQAQRIMITRRVNMHEKQRAAKKLCGIEEP
jgi:4-hydroxybutyryl-CoA dehydratase/vinylacetyl-CoA-Delta-isomerase